jgi:sirohydrochlorin cobaltochelatase
VSPPAAGTAGADVVAAWIARPPFRIGEIYGDRTDAGQFCLWHRDDAHSAGLRVFRSTDDAAEIARFDDYGKYRPLKTAPNLRHGWQLQLRDADDVRQALDLFYPGRLAAYAAHCAERLVSTPLRTTLERQTGMYRIAAKITDDEIDDVVASVCRSDGGCLRTICWTRDIIGAPASRLLPMAKFDPAVDQTGRGEPALPLLCQEACGILIGEARNAVKRSREHPSA